jgi:hypothetical protein
MIHAAQTVLTNPLTSPSWLRQPTAPLDIVATLSKALGFAWIAQREIDWEGEVSVIVLAAGDDEAMPAFILYETDGLAHVATVKHDEWQTGRAYATAEEAVAAIVSLTAGTAETNVGPMPGRPSKLVLGHAQDRQ